MIGKKLRNENIARKVVVKGCASKDAREYARAGFPNCLSNLHINIVHEFLLSSRINSSTYHAKLLRTTAALLSKYEARSRCVSSSLSTYVEPMLAISFGIVVVVSREAMTLGVDFGRLSFLGVSIRVTSIFHIDHDERAKTESNGAEAAPVSPRGSSEGLTRSRFSLRKLTYICFQTLTARETETLVPDANARTEAINFLLGTVDITLRVDWNWG